MKKIICLLLCIALGFVFVGCSEDGKKETSSKSETSSTSSSQGETSSKSESDIKEIEGRATLSNVSDFIELGEYKDINWEEGTAAKVLNQYLSQKCSPEEKIITDRPIKNGDIANINYVGKKDGVAFDSGTADNYDLTIGSNSFIDGFEEGLIGVSTGETVDLNLTFPEEYPSADLAGAKVVFTVTVNSIKTVSYKEKDIEAAKKASLFDASLMLGVENSTFKALPTGDIAIYEPRYQTYGAELAARYARETAKQQLVILAIAKENGLTVTEKEYETQLNSIIASSGKTRDAILKDYGRPYIEVMVLVEELQDLF